MRKAASAFLAVPFVLYGCATPKFDVGTDYGYPKITDVIKRLGCELTDLVKDGADSQEDLLDSNYAVGVQLELDVNDSGELNPQMNFPIDPTFAFHAGFKVGNSRTQHFTENLYFDLHNQYKLWQEAEKVKVTTGKNTMEDCPNDVGTLAGDLGIKQSVALALASSNRQPSELKGAAGEFGGFVNFVITKNVNAAGPSWKLTHFEGPGSLAMLQRINTDKITFGFAPGKPPKKGEKASPSDNQRLKDILNQLNLGQIQSAIISR